MIDGITVLSQSEIMITPNWIYHNNNYSYRICC